MATWQVQAAKQRFSEVIRGAETGEPQFITRHGAPVAVIVDIEGYRAAHDSDRPASFKAFVMSAPMFEELEFPDRVVEPIRASEMFGA